MMNFKVTKSDVVFRGKVFDIKLEEIEYNKTGNKGKREVVLHPGGAVVVPVTSDRNIIFVRQYRYPFDTIMTELPAGKLDKGEDPLKCASRELTEETGYSSGNIKELGKIFTSPGFCNEVLHIYSATDLIPGEHAREEGEEGMEIIELSLSEAEEKIRTGEIVDAKTISGLYMYKNKL
jgi:ADP-ribose pyrophosphatase